MPDAAAIAGDLVAALNARDYAAIAALCDEDVALSGIGAGGDQGREALRERLAAISPQATRASATPSSCRRSGDRRWRSG